jgi:hypothetical protein
VSDVVDTILPEQAIHIVAGPTGAGKSRWLLEMLQDWQAGRDVLGYKSHPRPWLYVSGDRQQIEVERTLLSMGLQPGNVPIMPAFGVMPVMGALGILEEAERREAELLVWEGFGKYVEANAGGNAVTRWLNMVTWRLSHTQNGTKRFKPLTIIGVMEQPKMKPKDQYQNARQRISGPAAWGHSASTIILVEHGDKSCKGPKRTLELYPRDGCDLSFKATLATGHFTIIP